MISNISGAGMYMPPMQQSGATGGPPKDGFQIVDSDASGGVSSTELETFSSKLQEAGGDAIDVDASIQAYDLDGDEQLNGDELFTLLSESGLTPIPPGGGTGGGPPPGGGGMASGGGGGMEPPPPPPPSTSMSSGISAYETDSLTEEEIYAQFIERLTAGGQSNTVSASLLNETA